MPWIPAPHCGPCRSSDAFECAARRYRVDTGDACQCSCHDHYEFDDEDEQREAARHSVKRLIPDSQR